MPTARPPLISLIMTVRDGARFLAQAVESVRAQTFADWELVLWDDGSTDDTPAIARQLASNEPRIRLLASEPIGRRRALVAAHREARGRVLGWVDADDWLAPEALERAYAVLARSGADLVYTDHIVVSADGEQRGLGRRAKIPYSPHRLLLDFMTFHLRLFTRDVFERAGGIAEDREIAIDYDLCLRISEVGRIKHLAEPLYFYREHGQQMSTRKRADQVAASAAAIRSALARRQLPYELSVDLERGRFQLVPPSPARRRAPERAGWVSVALATAFPRLRRDAPRKRALTVIGHWPATRHSMYRRQLSVAAEARGIAMRPLGNDLAPLMRSVWTGRAGDVLHIHSLAPLFSPADDGSVFATCVLFGKTLDHALARGMRIVWISAGPLTTHPRHRAREEAARRMLLERCHAVITHWHGDVERLRVLGAGSKLRVVPHPNLADHYPAVSREFARDRLGLAAGETPTLLYLGASPSHPGDGNLVLTGDVDAQPPRHVATYFGAADLAVIPPPAQVTSGALALAFAMGKPIVAPSLPGVTALVGDGAFLYSPYADEREVAHAVERACSARRDWERIGRDNVARARRWSWDAMLDASVG